MPESRALTVGPDPLEHLKAWRHAIQCAFAEERARQSLACVLEFVGPDSASVRTIQADLDAAGARLNGALYELHELVTAPHAGPATAPADPLAGSAITTRTIPT